MTGSVTGQCDPQFAELKAEFERNFAERGEVGASVCLSVNGDRQVDLWGGMADAAAGQAWTEETVSIVFSCTKAATALCAHILIDQGKLDPNALVSQYWPEFAKHGKEHTTVQMMLNHESGLPAFREPIKDGGFLDWDYMISRLEEEEPFWEPGTRNGYHMVSFGWTVGELVRRVSGQSLGAFFAEHVAGPTGAACAHTRRYGLSFCAGHVFRPEVYCSPLYTECWRLDGKLARSTQSRNWRGRRHIQCARAGGNVHPACG